MFGSHVRNLFALGMMSAVLLAGGVQMSNAQPLPTAVWNFDKTDPLHATVGEDLELVGSHLPIPGLDTNDGAALIFTGSHYRARHGIAANGGGSYVNEYTLVMDVKLPELGKWYALYNTNETNANDAETYIDDAGKVGVGATGYSATAVTAGMWHRIGIVVKLGDTATGIFDIYLNGALLHKGTPQGVDGRFSAYSTADSTPWILLFADPGGYDAPIFVSYAAMYDTVLTAEQVAALKGPGGNAGPVAGLPVDLNIPDTPVITNVTPAQPRNAEPVTLTASAFKSPGNKTHKKSVWQLSFDSSFQDKADGSKMLRSVIESETNLTSITLDNSLFPMDVPVYVRVQYADEVGTTSAFSQPVTITVRPPSNVKVLYSENFESAPIDGLPTGWKKLDLTDDASVLENLDYFNPQLVGWSVQETSFLDTLVYYPGYDTETLNINQIGYPIVQGKHAHADSGDYASSSLLYETHLLSPAYNLSKATDVSITFNSNYVQNQDNIAAMELSIQGGDIADGQIKGAWLPVLYYLDHGDLLKKDTGELDVDATLFTAADGTQLLYGDFIYADDSTSDLNTLAPYFVGRTDDNYKDGKRFEKIRIPAADKQAAVRFRWTYMGTWSWYWGIDNIQIWGNDGTVTSVSDWSLF